jgi:peptidoglycan/xylan/chitin deacetylase (PgdA/CDA1 family)
MERKHFLTIVMIIISVMVSYTVVNHAEPRNSKDPANVGDNKLNDNSTIGGNDDLKQQEPLLWNNLKNRSHLISTSKYAKAIPVLMYHHILEDKDYPKKDNGAIITAEAFREQMKYLFENGYNTITLEELELFIKGEINLPHRSVLITFDDGYLSNKIYAYPVLKEYDFYASIFMITGFIPEKKQEYDPSVLSYLTYEEMVEMADVFEYGAHTHNLHFLDGKTSHVLTKPDSDLIEDFKLNKELIKTDYFVYPYGQYNSRTIEILQELGFKMAFTTKEGKVKPGDNPFTLKRIGVFPWTTMERFKRLVN